MTQEDSGAANANHTMRPIVRGRHFAVASMKAEATRAAERILEQGGNAFDAIVAGQAVLSIVDGAMNGIDADATILFYDARSRRSIPSMPRHRATGDDRMVQKITAASCR
jgi:gamma-glutamyltranspeptidase